MRGVVLLFVAMAAILGSGAAWLVATEEAANAALPGENGKIAFSSNRTTGEGVDNPEGDAEIFALNPDGTGLAQVTHNANDERYPAWSPDGSRIAYAADGGIYTMPAAGGEPTRVSGTGVSGTDPAWSPDGSRIAYVGHVPDDPATPYYDPKSNVYTIPAGGGEPVLVYEGNAYSPEWSPDGSKIAFAAGGLWTVPADGGTPTRLAGQAYDRGVDWSPDGKTIAFVADDHTPVKPGYADSEIWTVPADGGTPTDLTGTGDQSYKDKYFPEWSPDGSKIAFAEETYGGCSPGFAIRAVPPGGETPTKVVELAGSGSGPDGLDWGTSPWRTAPDTEPPAVLCTGPDEGRDDESTNPWVAADFSEELDLATITPATFYLTKEGSGERVGATVGCDEESCRTATLSVTERLDYDTAYTATVEGGADGVKDDAGNALAEDESWSFTTYDGIEPAVSLTAPTAGARVSGPGVTLSAEATDRRGVKHVAFYVENDPSGTDYVQAGTDTTPGGPSGSEYSVSWDSAGVPDGPKTVKAFAMDVSGRYSSASAVVSVDNAVPSVVDVRPDARSRNMRRGADVVASFSEEMRRATVRAVTFMLVKARTGKRVAASVSCPAPCTEAELDPSAPLSANTRYRATVTTGARDTAGTALDQQADVAGAQPKVWSFTTGD